ISRALRGRFGERGPRADEAVQHICPWPPVAVLRRSSGAVGLEVPRSTTRRKARTLLSCHTALIVSGLQRGEG
ncbi:unnamed protein product, partial [Laminaria digitata]